jgi:hypothetical protein
MQNNVLNTFYQYLENNKLNTLTLNEYIQSWEANNNQIALVGYKNEQDFKVLEIDKDLFPFESLEKEAKNFEKLVSSFQANIITGENLKYLFLKGENNIPNIILISNNQLLPYFSIKIAFDVVKQLNEMTIED